MSSKMLLFVAFWKALYLHLCAKLAVTPRREISWMGLDKLNGRFRNVVADSARSASPRICMPTWRNFTKAAFRCGLYEAQDILVENDNVHLVHLDMTWGAWFKEASLRRPLYHDVSRKLIYANPGLKKVRLTGEYDLFIVVCDVWTDIPCINAIERWRDHCKISICWIDEMWAAAIPKYKYWLHALNQFDYVFVGYKGTVAALSQAANRPCYWLPRAVDTLRFSPYPDPPERVIDVYNIGRRREGIHCEMLKAAEQGKLFYVYDTLAGSKTDTAATDVYDYRQHRSLFTNMAKRSRYFLVAPAKMDALSETRGQVEVGARYYEGAAAGTVMIGEAPDCDAYMELFGWPEAVIPMSPNGSEVTAVLSDLDSDPERTSAISRRNAKEALLRHDWAYRWNEMFRIVGIEPSVRMAARERCLKDIADCVAGAI
jgi:spore maturation protein CgeB